MSQGQQDDDAAFRAFLRRVWREDIAPLLRDGQAARRRYLARGVGTAAAGAGLLVDQLFRLRGRPFTRFMTVVGGSVGALLPDAWEWGWLRERADDAQRATVADCVRRRAADLEDADARALLHVSPGCSADELRAAWRRATLRWHPDKAATAAERREHHVRFIALQAAYERLSRND